MVKKIILLFILFIVIVNFKAFAWNDKATVSTITLRPVPHGFCPKIKTFTGYEISPCGKEAALLQTNNCVDQFECFLAEHKHIIVYIKETVYNSHGGPVAITIYYN